MFSNHFDWLFFVCLRNSVTQVAKRKQAPHGTYHDCGKQIVDQQNRNHKGQCKKKFSKKCSDGRFSYFGSIWNATTLLWDVDTECVRHCVCDRDSQYSTDDSQFGMCPRKESDHQTECGDDARGDSEIYSNFDRFIEKHMEREENKYQGNMGLVYVCKFFSFSLENFQQLYNIAPVTYTCRFIS